MIALPTKIQGLNPLWASCSDNYCPFTGLDPPRTLVPESELTPTTTATTGDPAASGTIDPKDSQDPKVTSTWSNPTPVATPHLVHPTKTAAPLVIPSTMSSSDPPKPDSPSDTQDPWSEQPAANPVFLDPNSPARSVESNYQGSHETLKPVGGGHAETPAHTQPKTKGASPDGPLTQAGYNIPSAPKENGPFIVPYGPITTLPDGVVMSALPNGRYLYRGATLIPGAPPLTVLGKAVSLDRSHNLAISDTTYTLPTIIGFVQPSTTDIDGQVITFKSDGVLVAGITLTPGSPAVYSSGIKISVDSTALVVGSHTVPIPDLSNQRSRQYIVNHLLTQYAGAVAIAGITLLPDGQPMTLSGTVISLKPWALVVGSRTIHFSQTLEAQNLATVAGEVATLLPYTAAVALASINPVPGDQQPTPPTPTPLGDKTALAVVSQTMPLRIPTSEAVELVTTIAGELATLLPHAMAVGGTIFTSSGPPLTLSASALSLASNALVINSKTIALRLPNSGGPPITTTIAGHLMTILAGGVAVDGITLVPGGPPLTFSGTALSPPNSRGPPITTKIAGEFLTILPGSGVAIDGVTLRPGQSGTVIDGISVSVDPEGQLVVGTSKLSEVPLGSLIVAGFGKGGVDSGTATAASSNASLNGSSPNGSTQGVEGFRGRAGKLGDPRRLLCRLLIWFGLQIMVG